MPPRARPCHRSATPFGSYKLTESCPQSWLEAVWMFVMTHVIKLDCPAWLPRQHVAPAPNTSVPPCLPVCFAALAMAVQEPVETTVSHSPFLPLGVCGGEHAVCVHACGSYGRTLAGFFHFLLPRCLETGSLTDPDACNCC